MKKESSMSLSKKIKGEQAKLLIPLSQSFRFYSVSGSNAQCSGERHKADNNNSLIK